MTFDRHLCYDNYILIKTFLVTVSHRMLVHSCRRAARPDGVLGSPWNRFGHNRNASHQHIQRLSSALLIRWGQVAAATVLTIVPTVLLFSFVQGRLVEGLTAGAVKGE